MFLNEIGYFERNLVYLTWLYQTLIKVSSKSWSILYNTYYIYK